MNCCKVVKLARTLNQILKSKRTNLRTVDLAALSSEGIVELALATGGVALTDAGAGRVLHVEEEGKGRRIEIIERSDLAEELAGAVARQVGRRQAVAHGAVHVAVRLGGEDERRVGGAEALDAGVAPAGGAPLDGRQTRAQVRLHVVGQRCVDQARVEALALAVRVQHQTPHALLAVPVNLATTKPTLAPLPTPFQPTLSSKPLTDHLI